MYGYSIYRLDHLLSHLLLLLLPSRAFCFTVCGDSDSAATYRFQTGLFALLPSPVRDAI
jgi:thiamine pyrophosphokinase